MSTCFNKFVDGDDYVDFSCLEENFFNCDAFYTDYFRFSHIEKKYIALPHSLARRPRKWNYNLRTIPKGKFFINSKIFIESEVYVSLV